MRGARLGRGAKRAVVHDPIITRRPSHTMRRFRLWHLPSPSCGSASRPDPIHHAFGGPRLRLLRRGAGATRLAVSGDGFFASSCGMSVSPDAPLTSSAAVPASAEWPSRASSAVSSSALGGLAAGKFWKAPGPLAFLAARSHARAAAFSSRKWPTYRPMPLPSTRIAFQRLFRSTHVTPRYFECCFLRDSRR